MGKSLNDKNGGQWVYDRGLYREGNSTASGNHDGVLSRRSGRHSFVPRGKRSVLWFGAVLGLACTCNGYANTENIAPPGPTSEQAAHSVLGSASAGVAADAVAVELAATETAPGLNNDTVYRGDQGASGEAAEAPLQVANLQTSYHQPQAGVEATDGGDSDGMDKKGAPYAILLAVGALIGLVPVARRNRGL